MYRQPQQVTWYAYVKPRCEAETLRDKKCVNSATYNAYMPSEYVAKLCKIHADIASYDYPVELIGKPLRVQLRED